jgi:MAF protein
MDIILASTSPYRRRLLERLHLDFRCVAPTTDESPMPGEAPAATAARLARLKAQSVASAYPEALVIGSDQVASIDRVQMGKPGSHEAAQQQLRASSGREVCFHTGIALLSLARGVQQFHVEPFRVQFRTLGDAQIARYLASEQPYDCAGSFKVEGLGIALFERLTGSDPSSLEGLPLIALTGMLHLAGVEVL